ncbi:hypothetical protein ACTXGQ_15215 [Marinobacter sp. 1Y8]
MFLALLLSFVLVLFIFLVVGPPVGYFVFVLASPASLDGFLSDLFPAYIGGIVPALLAGLANWALLISLYPRFSRLKINLLSILASGVAAPMIVGWQIAVVGKVGFLFLFLLVCVTATATCIFLVNKPAFNILEDLGARNANP